MIKIGTHVFHKTIIANGVVTDVKPEAFKINFFWAKYCDVANGFWSDRPERGTKWEWCRREDLIPLPDINPINKVTSIGNRSLDRLIRRICQIDHRRRNDNSDIVICYGQSNHRVSHNVFMVNRHLIMDKGEQMAILGEELAPKSYWGVQVIPNDANNLIVKPKISIGGRGIRRYQKGMHVGGHEYLQEEFKKVREFRVHCFLWSDNPVIFIQEKVIGNPDQLCWNKKQGGTFRYPYTEGLEGKYTGSISLQNINVMRRMSVKALKKLRYDFGGLDFGMDALGNFKIFEVNSRMGLREKSFFVYKQMFNKLKELDIEKYKAERWI